MRLWPRSYHMLVCSLPSLPPRFDAERLPITPERLQDRLRLLEPEDTREMGRLLDVLTWSREFAESSDAAVARRYGELMRLIRHPLVREVAATGIDVRVILTALRRRRRGLGPPEVPIGRWFEHIRRHFHKPDFGLGHVFPRLAEFHALLEQGNLLAFHRGLMEATWAHLKKRAEDHYFTFEAVVLYVARWEVIRTWHQLEAERGRAIFQNLVTEALGGHADIYS